MRCDRCVQGKHARSHFAGSRASGVRVFVSDRVEKIQQRNWQEIF